MGFQTLRMRVADAAVLAGNGARAVAVRPQNGWGHALVAERQFSDKDVKAAIASSMQALDRTPLSVIAVRTLARSLDTTAPAGGERAWQVASTMGWRDVPTQFWALLRALSNGQTDIFVMRADALMRAGTDDPKMISVIRQAMLDPRIRAAFVKRIALDPQWRSRLFTSDGALSGRELQGALLALHDLSQTSAPPTRAELRDPLASLVAARRYAEAADLDKRYLPRTPDEGSMIDDGGFERGDYGKNATPFDWNIVKGTTLEHSGGSNSLLLIRDERYVPLVTRLVALAPGQYRLAYSMKGEPNSAMSLGFRVGCVGSKEDIAASSRQPLAGEGWEKRAFVFSVPADCPLTSLKLTAFESAGHAEAQFDDVKIAPVNATIPTGPAVRR
jgi:hypothetical protein